MSKQPTPDAPCAVKEFSSCACSKGTRGCEANHAAPSDEPSDYPIIGWCPVCNAPRRMIETGGCEVCFNHVLKIQDPWKQQLREEAQAERLFEMQNAAIDISKKLKAAEESAEYAWKNTREIDKVRIEAERQLVGHKADARKSTPAIIDVLAERKRQVSAEGWTPEHDDEHEAGDLATAAACYAGNAGGYVWQGGWPGEVWPWAREWWKPSTPRRDLVKAGALILAEIERIDRANEEQTL